MNRLVVLGSSNMLLLLTEALGSLACINEREENFSCGGVVFLDHWLISIQLVVGLWPSRCDGPGLYHQRRVTLRYIARIF